MDRTAGVFIFYKSTKLTRKIGVNSVCKILLIFCLAPNNGEAQ